MKATSITATREWVGQDAFVELVIWHVPEPIVGSSHPFKYRLVHVVENRCVLRYDNEIGKGDHKHIGGREIPYSFTTIDALLGDFWLTLDEVSEEMGTVTFGISSIADSNERFEAAFRGEKQAPRMDFPNTEFLFKVMTAERWELVRRMAGAGAFSILDLARRVERDPDNVYADVRALLNCGVLYSTQDGRIIFPFKAIHIDVLLEAAA